MPLRDSENASSYPRKSKSISSLRRPQLKHAKSFNTSELAHHEALTAAELAFNRAKERCAVRNESDHARTIMTTQGSLGASDRQLGKKQSIRFTGSNAVKTRELPNTRREVCNVQGYPVLKDHVPRPEYVESTVASEPSSYRRLRRAKSMFNPVGLQSESHIDGTQTNGAHFKRESMRSSESQNESVRSPNHHLRRSFSFLRGVTDRLSTVSQDCATNDAAVQFAQQQYLVQIEEQRLKERPSFLNLARRREAPRGFPRTVRTSSVTSNETSTQSPLLSVNGNKVSSTSRKARAISQSFKKTLKRVFGRPLLNDKRLPQQQLSATRFHYGESWGHQSPLMSSPDIELLRRVDSHGSISQEVIRLNEDSKATAESIRNSTSVDENSNIQSRVSSWSNSTTGNTIITPQFVERKRLSVIKEDGGPHQPSYSTATYIDREDGYSAFRQPVRLDNTGPVAAQRIYSALQREIYKSGADTARDDYESEADSNSDEAYSRPSRSTLRKASSSHTRNDSQSTASLASAGNSASRSVLLISDASADLELPADQDPNLHPGLDREFSEPVKRFTPQQIAHFVEPEIRTPKKPLREVKSAFFPSESRIEQRATSPYRRMMYDAGDGPSDARAYNRYASSNNWLTSPRKLASVLKSSATLSESVYSRTEGGNSPGLVDSSSSLPKIDSSEESGTAIILPSQNHLFGAYTSPHPSWRTRSNQSSGEWKNWMASEVSHFQNHVEEHEDIYNAFPVKDSGHKRENAQWDGDETAIGRVVGSLHSSKQPLGTIQTKTLARSALQESTPRSNVATSLVSKVITPENNSTTLQKENKPRSYAQSLFNKQIDIVDSSMTSIPMAANSLDPGIKVPQMSLRACKEDKNSRHDEDDELNPRQTQSFHTISNESSQSLKKTGISPNMRDAVDGYTSKQTTTHGSPLPPDWTEQATSSSNDQFVARKRSVGESLRKRRTDMRISDESGGDPAFI